MQTGIASLEILRRIWYGERGEGDREKKERRKEKLVGINLFSSFMEKECLLMVITPRLKENGNLEFLQVPLVLWTC